MTPELVAMLTRDDLQSNTKADLIRSDLLRRCHTFDRLLRPYRQDRIRGTILEDTITIPEDAISVEDDLTGVVAFEFEEEAHYGCSDMNNIHDHYDDMGFTVHLNREVIVLHGMDEQERDPDDL